MLKVPFILFAEDSEDDTYFARRCFKTAGIEIELRRCCNGVELIRDLQSCEADLPLGIILDLKMPLMDGFETLKWIREQPAYRQLPVVILSSSALMEDQVRARELGCTEYLVKPGSLAKLEDLLRGLVKRFVARSNLPNLNPALSHAALPGKTLRRH
jgi:CheY-like chemotaxis protein